LQEAGKQWQELLVEKIMAASADGAKECAEQQEVIERLVGGASEFHRPVYDRVEVWLSTFTT